MSRLFFSPLAPVAPLAAALTLTLTMPALANGRFPQATQLVLSATDANSIVARSTFGLITSHDHGATWSWVCESVTGIEQSSEDPGVVLFADGTIALGEFEGLSISHDDGCSWAFIADGLTGEYVIDDARDGIDPSHGVAITSTGIGDDAFHVQVYSTSDNGVTWAPTGSALETDFLAVTVDVAPSDSNRLYASGTSSANGSLVGIVQTSKDRGMTWTKATVDLMGETSLYIAGVDPKDPDRVYARTYLKPVDANDDTPNDRLLMSTDGGQTFTEVQHVMGNLEGFALSPDGSQIASGGEKSGLFIASAADMKFNFVTDVEVACLAWSTDGLYACDRGYEHGFVLGITSDQGQTWKPLLPALADIVGPLDGCGASSQYDLQCNQQWPALATMFGKGGAGGSDTSAGGSAGAPAGGDQSADASSASDGSGCKCSMQSRAPGSIALAMAAVAGGLLRRRRRH